MPTYEPLLGAASFLGAEIKRFERKAGEGFRLDPRRRSRAAMTRAHAADRPHQPPQSRAARWPSEDDLRAIGELAAQVGARVLIDEVYLDAAVPPRPKRRPSRPRVRLHQQPDQGLRPQRPALRLDPRRARARRADVAAERPVRRQPGAPGRAARLHRLRASRRGRSATTPALLAAQPRAVQRLRRRPRRPRRARRPSTASPPSRAGPAATPTRSMRCCASATTPPIVPGRWFDMPDHFRVGFGWPTDDVRGRPGPARRGAGRAAMKREQIFEFFRRLAEANPSPDDRARIPSTPTPCSSRSSCPPRRPTPASTSRPGRCSSGSRRREQMVALGEEGLRDAIKTIGLFNTKAKNVIALSRGADRRAWRRGARRRATSCRRCPASAARPPMSCSTPPSARRRSRSTRTSSASATAPASRRARTARRGRGEAREGRARSPSGRNAHHWLILHGRYICKARKPECWRCPVIDLCRYKPKTPRAEDD